jgi:hypothetical protein
VVPDLLPHGRAAQRSLGGVRLAGRRHDEGAGTEGCRCRSRRRPRGGAVREPAEAYSPSADGNDGRPERTTRALEETPAKDGDYTILREKTDLKHCLLEIVSGRKNIDRHLDAEKVDLLNYVIILIFIFFA